MLNCRGKIDQNVSADDHLRQEVCMGMLSRRQRKGWKVASDLMEKSLHHWNQVDFVRVPSVNWRFPATQFLQRVRTKRVQILSSHYMDISTICTPGTSRRHRCALFPSKNNIIIKDVLLWINSEILLGNARTPRPLLAYHSTSRLHSCNNFASGLLPIPDDV